MKTDFMEYGTLAKFSLPIRRLAYNRLRHKAFVYHNPIMKRICLSPTLFAQSPSLNRGVWSVFLDWNIRLLTAFSTFIVHSG